MPLGRTDTTQLTHLTRCAARPQGLPGEPCDDADVSFRRYPPGFSLMLRARRSLSLLLCLLLMAHAPARVAIAADVALPEFGDPSGSFLSPGSDKRLGQQFMRWVRASKKLENDPLLTDYLQSIGNKLTRESDDPSRSFNFFWVRDPTINAFAGPGGNIGMHTGLILETETESEFAAVLAHEIAHVTQRHIARMIEAADRMSLPAAGLLLAAALLGAAGGGDAALAAAVGGQAALLQKEINFTRANEQEADRVGMQVLSEADFDPRAMPVFFQRMGRAGRTSGISVPEYLRTHPVTTSRISDSLARAESYPYRQVPEDIRYHLTRAALRAQQFSEPGAAVLHFESTLRDGRYRHEDSEHYGYAIALQRAGKMTEARREIDALLARNPNQLEYQVVSARLYTEAGEPRRATATLQKGLAQRPGSYPLSLTLAGSMLQTGDDAGAYKVLRGMVKSHPDDPAVFSLMARAAAGTGKAAESHAYLAEYHYGMGELDAAVRQLEIASRSDGIDFYSRSRVEARLEALRAESEALRKEARRGGG